MSAHVVFRRGRDGKCTRVGSFSHGEYRPIKPPNPYVSVARGRHHVRTGIDHEAVEARRLRITRWRDWSLGEPTMDEVDALVEQFGELSLAEVGIVFSFSRERARQIEVLALRKIRRNEEMREWRAREGHR